MPDESTEQLKQAARHWLRVHRSSIRDMVVGWLAFEAILCGAFFLAIGLMVLIMILAR